DGTLKLAGIPKPPAAPIGSECALFTLAPGFTELGPGNYAIIAGGDTDCFDHLWVTSDYGQSWGHMGTPPPFDRDDADYFAPQASFLSGPVFYLQNFAFGDLFRLSGPEDTSAALTPLRTEGLQLARSVFAVSPVDPNFLYVSDVQSQQM